MIGVSCLRLNQVGYPTIKQMENEQKQTATVLLT
jgi:hypothetical protein